MKKICIILLYLFTSFSLSYAEDLANKSYSVDSNFAAIKECQKKIGCAEHNYKCESNSPCGSCDLLCQQTYSNNIKNDIPDRDALFDQCKKTCLACYNSCNNLPDCHKNCKPTQDKKHKKSPKSNQLEELTSKKKL